MIFMLYLVVFQLHLMLLVSAFVILYYLFYLVFIINIKINFILKKSVQSKKYKIKILNKLTIYIKNSILKNDFYIF